MQRLAWVVVLALSGCSSTAADEPRAASCVPGEQVDCACPGSSASGVQVCAESGDRYGACTGCGLNGGGWPDGGAGAGSTGGAAGAAGVGGAGATGPGGSGGSGGAGAVPGSPSGPPQAVWPAPAPDAYAVVSQTAADHPDWLAASCKDEGGNNEFLFEVVRRLRQQDDRWGLNWKRGNVGDMSQDVVDYHWGEGVSENSTDVYIIDVITGHCGPSPSPGWIDVTQATLDANEIGRWTLAGNSSL